MGCILFTKKRVRACEIQKKILLLQRNLE